jgi:hypothetical protein
MKRDKIIDKSLLRMQPDEIYPQKTRINGKIKTIRKFCLISQAFPSRTMYFVYYKNNKPVATGKMSKSELFTAMRKFAVEL